MIDAKEIAESLDIEPKLHEKQIIRRKKHFNEDIIDETEATETTKESFRVKKLILPRLMLRRLQSQ